MSNFNHDDICTEINSIILNGISKKDQEICNLKDTIRKMEEKMRFMDDSKTIKKKEKFFDEQMKRYFEKEREVDEKMEKYKKEFIPSSLLQEEIEQLRNEKKVYEEEMNNKISVYEKDKVTLNTLIVKLNMHLKDKNSTIALLQDKLKSFDKNIVTKYNILKESYQSLESNSKEQISNLEKQLNEIENEKKKSSNDKNLYEDYRQKLEEKDNMIAFLEEKHKSFDEHKVRFNSFKESILELIE